MITAPFGGWLFDYFGRKLSIILCSIPYTIGWLLIILTVATDGPVFRPLLFTGRFVLGIGVGWTSVSGGVSHYNVVKYIHIIVPQYTREFLMSVSDSIELRMQNSWGIVLERYFETEQIVI